MIDISKIKDYPDIEYKEPYRVWILDKVRDITKPDNFIGVISDIRKEDFKMLITWYDIEYSLTNHVSRSWIDTDCKDIVLVEPNLKSHKWQHLK